MVIATNIEKAVKRDRNGYKKSSKEAKKEIGKVIAGDIRLERKILNKF